MPSPQDALAQLWSLAELPPDGCNLDEILGEVERRYLLQALERTNGVRTAAAKLLGMTLRSLRYRLQKHALESAENMESGSGTMEAASEDDGRNSSVPKAST